MFCRVYALEQVWQLGTELILYPNVVKDALVVRNCAECGTFLIEMRAECPVQCLVDVHGVFMRKLFEVGVLAHSPDVFGVDLHLFDFPQEGLHVVDVV